MKPKHKRLIFIVFGLMCVGSAVGLILNSFNDNLVFFYSPSDLKEKHIEDGKIIRIGGLVEDGSLIVQGGNITKFVITDLKNKIDVTYTGILPPMFREGQGMVAKGKLGENNIFIADNLLTKHDEKYMPPEVADALKKSGEWRPEQ